MMRAFARLGLLVVVAFMPLVLTAPQILAVSSLQLAMVRLDRMQVGVTAPVTLAVMSGRSDVAKITVTFPSGFGLSGATAVSGQNDLGLPELPGSLSLSRSGSTLSVDGISGMSGGQPYGLTITQVTNPGVGGYTASVSTYDSANQLLESSAVGLSILASDQLGVSIASHNSCASADLNHNHRVDIFDLSIVLSTYATSNTRGDVNGDGTVNVFDLSRLLTCYGSSV